jgi:hypothetical protein
MAEYSREIRESCARILKLLQEEIDASKLSTVQEDVFSSVESIEEHYATDQEHEITRLKANEEIKVLGRNRRNP